MLYGDSYLNLKLESCRLKGVVVCVCGMPQSPIVIFENDGCYYTRCHSCSTTLSVNARAALLTQEPHYSGRDPGVWINYRQSELIMNFYCMCGNERQLIGSLNECPPCDVCRFQFLLPHKLEVRELPRGYAFDCSPVAGSRRGDAWRGEPLVRFAVESGAAEVVSDLPDVSAKVAAFKRNPYHFLAATMGKIGDKTNEQKSQKDHALSETSEIEADERE